MHMLLMPGLAAVLALALACMGWWSGLFWKVTALLVNGGVSLIFAYGGAALSPAPHAALYWLTAWATYMAAVCAFMWRKLHLKRVWVPLGTAALALAAAVL